MIHHGGPAQMDRRQILKGVAWGALLTGFAAWAEADAASLGFDRQKVDAHRQLFDLSCIPSGVEMILKLTGRVPQDYFMLQQAWKNRDVGTFADFDHRKVAGVAFRRRFPMARGPKFPLKSLFGAIDGELTHGRYVLVSLNNGDPGGYHIWVIVQRLEGGEYRALSKDGQETIEITDTRKQIEAMQGTDILTYSLSNSMR